MIPFKKTLLAVGLVAISSSVASARVAVVENDLHLRAGRGPDTAIIATMPQGATVDAWNCDDGWCRVRYGGDIGFASARYLDIGRARYWRRGYRDYAYEPGFPFRFAPWYW
jgi:uncharacterized protein YraI